MPRRKWLPLLVLGALLLALATVWRLWWPPLTSTETAILGSWSSALQPDGLSTVVLLRADRTGTVRWLNQDGVDGRAAHECRWWVEGEMLFVDTSRVPGFWEFKMPSRNPANAWPFAIQEDTLLFGPQTEAPLALRRVGKQ